MKKESINDQSTIEIMYIPHHKSVTFGCLSQFKMQLHPYNIATEQSTNSS